MASDKISVQHKTALEIAKALHASDFTKEQAAKKIKDRFPKLPSEEIESVLDEEYQSEKSVVVEEPDALEPSSQEFSSEALIDQIYNKISSLKKVEINTLIKNMNLSIEDPLLKRQKIENLSRKLEQFGLIEVSTPLMNFKGGPLFGSMYLIFREQGGVLSE